MQCRLAQVAPAYLLALCMRVFQIRNSEISNVAFFRSYSPRLFRECPICIAETVPMLSHPKRIMRPRPRRKLKKSAEKRPPALANVSDIVSLRSIRNCVFRHGLNEVDGYIEVWLFSIAFNSFRLRIARTSLALGFRLVVYLRSVGRQTIYIPFAF